MSWRRCPRDPEPPPPIPTRLLVDLPVMHREIAQNARGEMILALSCNPCHAGRCRPLDGGEHVDFANSEGEGRRRLLLSGGSGLGPPNRGNYVDAIDAGWIDGVRFVKGDH